MEPVNYRWELGKVEGKPKFTDRYGNVRENVIQSAELVFIGERGDEIYSNKYVAYFDITELSTFKDINTVTKEEITQWAFDKLVDKTKIAIETSVKILFNDVATNTVIFDIK